jgi:hypothetical protein
MIYTHIMFVPQITDAVKLDGKAEAPLAKGKLAGDHLLYHKSTSSLKSVYSCVTEEAMGGLGVVELRIEQISATKLKDVEWSIVKVCMAK